MTKRKFITLGLLLIALGPFLMALHLYLFMRHYITEPNVLIMLTIGPGLQLLFGALLWVRTRSKGNSRLTTSVYLVGYTALFFIGLGIATLLAGPSLDLFSKIVLSFLPEQPMKHDFDAWRAAGSIGDVHFSWQTIFEMASAGVLLATLGNIGLFATLILGARNPRGPMGPSAIDRLAARVSKKLAFTAQAKKQSLA